MESLDFSTLNSAKHGNLANSINSAKSNKILLDNISNHYLFEEEVHMSFSIMRKYENLIRANLKKITLPKEFHYRPEYLSQELYGTTDLWYLIMFVNNVVDVNKFTMDEVYVPTENFLEVFGKLISSEKEMKKSITQPIPIYKHILKDLDKPSKQVLPSDFDAELGDLTDLKDYEDVTNNYFTNENFANFGLHVMRGKLLTEIYSIESSLDEKLVKESLSSSLYKLDNYKVFGEDIRIIKNGYIKPFEFGNYEFKVWSDGNFQMFIDNKSVINYIGDNTSINSARTKNLFEEYSLNSDFKRRNLDYWNVNNAKLVYSDKFNKNFLERILHNPSLNEIEIFNVDIPRTEISFENEGDIIYDVEYYLPDRERYHTLIQEVEITTREGQKLISKRETEVSRETSEEFNIIRMIAIKGAVTNNDITNIKLKLSYKSDSNFIDNVTKLHINRIKMFTIESKTYSVSLNLNKLYTFKSIYDKTSEHSDFFTVMWKKEGNSNFDYIPDNVFYTDLDFNKELDTTECVMIESYLSNGILDNQFMHNDISLNSTKSKLGINNSSNKLKLSFNVKENYFKKRLKLKGDSNHKIILKDSNEKVIATKEYTDTEIIVDLRKNNTQSFILEVQLKTNTINFAIDCEINNAFQKVNKEYIQYLPQESIALVFGNHTIELPKFKPNERSYYKMIGKTPVPNDWILDMEFKLSDRDFTRKGLFGILFDMNDAQSLYALIFRCKGENQHIQSGIYKMSKDKDIMFLDNTFEHKYFKEEMVLMKPLDIEIDKVNKKIKILKKDGIIMLCKDGERYPFERIEDKFAPYTNGHLGFMVFQQDNIKINATLWN